ncbi:AsnC family transcriptional regulator [Nitrososphaera sp.]|uniref:AsnC family transcriptional regulator n=1 Tax=Nitrososphaera sp. TaxID=1971748 RepID=UPI00307E1187
MPVQLDDTDIAIIKSLMEDGRKSFRAVSREIKVSTPTVKARYERLVNIGLIKSVRPEIDVSKIDASRREQIQLPDKGRHRGHHVHLKVVDGLKVKMVCEFCGGPVHGKPKVLRFANLERFFCCIACRNNYREKYAGRIESLIEQHREEKKKNKSSSSVSR